MTKRERILQALKTEGTSQDTLDDLIKVAYWMGREDEAKYAGDKIKSHLKEQHQRADDCRYHCMAKSVVGPDTFIYLPNYSGDYGREFGNDKTEL
jgi:hypothetical protein